MLTFLLSFKSLSLSLGLVMAFQSMPPTVALPRSAPTQAQSTVARQRPTTPIEPISQGVTHSQIAKLQELLKDKKWAAADQETRRLLKEIDKVPNSQLRAIDQAWLQASNRRFGLSIQAKIWQQSLAKYPPRDRQRAIDAFRDRVGWKLTKPRQENDFISSDWRNESELNYSSQAPLGHLPWAGVADAEVYALAAGAAEGCGSCTTDAMQLRNERFYIYLPQLFNHVQTAINMRYRP
jgi:uncharacterized protein